MKHTIDDLRGISGGTETDRKIATAFAVQALEEANKRMSVILSICNLGSVLDSSELTKATDAIAGIRHITVAVEGAAEFHHQGQLDETLSGLHSKLLIIREEAEGKYRWLKMLFHGADDFASPSP